MQERTIPYIEVWDLLINTQSLMNILSRKVQMKFQLAPQELRVMLELDRASNMNISQLSKAIHRDFGNVSRTCGALVKKGLLYREKAEDDQRVTLVNLTPLGKEKLKIFYDYSLAMIQWGLLEENKNEYEAMMAGMKLFHSFVIDRMEALND